MNWIDRTRAWLNRPFAHLGAGRQAAHAAPAASAPAAPAPGEVAWADGLFFGAVPVARWNPDALVGQRGFATYREMLHDEQIRALLALKQAAIGGRSWRFRLVRDDARQRRCAAFLRFVLEEQLCGTFRQALADLLSSQAFGFSLLEKVYAPVVWRGRTHWGLRALKLRPPETFAFEVDAHGNRTALHQTQGPRTVALPPERFIHHVNKPHADAQYGESDLRECYRHWWAKEHVLKFWNVYLERMAAGFIHGRVKGQLTPTEREELQRAMRNINVRSSVVTPANVELDVVSAPTTDAFERAVAARDRAISRALLVPNLLGFTEPGQVGSYSQSRTQLETFLLVLSGIAESVADTLNEQLFRELARWNFGLNDPPLFTFEPLTPEQRRDLARAWETAVRSGTVTATGHDEARVRELLGFPAAEAHA